MSSVAAQRKCDLFINVTCKDVLHLYNSFEQTSGNGKMKLYIFFTAVGGQAEENQDANNYYANHL